MHLNTEITRHKNLLPVIILLCLCLYTAYEVFFNNVVGTIQNILGFVFVLVDIICYFYARKQFKYWVFATLLLGLLGVLNFTPFIYTITVVFITFHVIPFLFIIFYCLLNLKRILATKDNDINIPDHKKVENLMDRYQNRTTEQLKDIRNSNRYSIEAKTAASELLKARSRNNTEENIH